MFIPPISGISGPMSAGLRYTTELMHDYQQLQILRASQSARPDQTAADPAAHERNAPIHFSRGSRDYIRSRSVRQAAISGKAAMNRIDLDGMGFGQNMLIERPFVVEPVPENMQELGAMRSDEASSRLHAGAGQDGRLQNQSRRGTGLPQTAGDLASLAAKRSQNQRAAFLSWIAISERNEARA